MFALALIGASAHAAVSIEGTDGVIYNIQGETMTVKVSTKNMSLFNEMAGNITIPAQVVDCSNTAVTDQPYTVIGIEDGAFKNCVKLQSVVITAPIDEIPFECFRGCTALASVTLSPTIKTIGENAFLDCATLTTFTGLGSATSIGMSAFENCSALTAVELGEGLTELKNTTFLNCTSLTQVKTPSTLKRIGRRTFKGCTALETVELNEGLTFIDDEVFYQCSSLKAPDFPSTLTWIGGNAFSYCPNLGDVALNGGVTLKSETFRYTGMTSLTFPTDKPVSFYSTHQFANVSTLQEVTLPANLSMCDNMFEACPDLTTVSFAEGFTTVSKESFKDCPKLTTLNFSSTVATIKNSAFLNDAAITNLQFPPTMKLIQTGAFGGCTGIGTLKLPAEVNLEGNAFGSTNLTAIEFPHATMGTLNYRPFGAQPLITEMFFPKELGSIPASLCDSWEALETIELEEGITKIGTESFKSCGSLTTLTLPSTLETIGYGAFDGCKSLTEIDFPEGLVGIASCAFIGTKLTEVVFPSSLRWIGNAKCLNNTVGAFAGVTTLRSVYFNDGCTSIDEQTFLGCSKLTDLHLPATLETICQNAFSGCSSLRNLDLPPSLKLVEAGAFGYCSNLGEVTLPAGCVFDDNVFTRSKISTINFPEEPCFFTGGGCFGFNEAITSVTLPEWLETIPQGMFRSCSNLTSVAWSKTLKKISDAAFISTPLASVDFPPTLEWVGKEAFSNCPLGSLRLTAGTYFDNNAFESAKPSEIIFPETACTFGTEVFKNNTSITELTLPEWMTEVPESFFIGLPSSNLTTLVLSPSTVKIGASAFRQHPKLHDVVMPSTLTDFGAYCFAECGSNLQKFGTIELYQDVNIGDYAFFNTYVDGIEFKGCAHFGTGSLEMIHGVSKITFPSCMKVISSSFCSGWTELTEVNIPEGVEKIGSYVFSGCSALKSLQLPSTITEIGGYAFNKCGIEELIMPDNDVKLGEQVFVSSKIKYVEFSHKQTNISHACFWSVNTLEKVLFRPAPEGETAADIKFEGQSFKATSLPEIVFPDANIDLDVEAFNSSKITRIVWPGDDKKVTFTSVGQFQYCPNLESVSFPAGVTSISRYCFASCGKLNYVKLGENVETIEMRAFQYSNLKEIVWNEKLRTIESDAFTYCGFETLVFPPMQTSMDTNVFSYCPYLKEVIFEEGTKIGYINSYTFQHCYALQRINIPATITRIYRYAFDNCTSLSSLTFNEGLREIGDYAFRHCDALKKVEFPSTITSFGSDCFWYCKTLEEVIDHSSAPLAYEQFKFCDKMKRYVAEQSKESIGNLCFYDCEELESFEYLGDTPIGSFGEKAFAKCFALPNADFFVAPTEVGECLFMNDTSLKQITIPSNIGKTPSGIVQNCENLESIIWASTGKTFKVTPWDLQNAPLHALSFSYAKDIDMPTAVDNTCSIDKYTPYSYYPTTNPDESILMVERGERWKYMTQGYDKLFTIREMVNPQVELYGDIFSTYQEEGNYNKYQVNLRWHMPLSDLNLNDSTIVHIFRDNKEIGVVRLSVPYTPTEAPWWLADHEPQNLIAVDVAYKNNENHSFKGNFLGMESNNKYWRMEWSVQQPGTIYFDAYTHKRLLDFAHYGHKSWFAISDEFNGPELTSDDVRPFYTYHAEMEPFSYKTLENNPGLEVRDGKMYREVEYNPTDRIVSNDVVVYTTLADPTLSFAGLLTPDDIDEDTDRHFSPTEPHSSSRSYNVGYTIDENPFWQRLHDADDDTYHYLINRVEVHELSDGNSKKVSDVTFSDEPTKRTGAKGNITLTAAEKPKPGNRYQTVSSSPYRGSFGSAAVTIPDVPEITSATLTLTPHPDALEQGNGHSHQLCPVRGRLTIKLNAVPTGYSSKLTTKDFYLGLWRKLNVANDLSPMFAAASGTSTLDDADLIHHQDGRNEDNTQHECSVCDSDHSLSVDPETGDIIYDDIFYLPWNSPANPTYNGRIYLQVPQEMLRTDVKYMAVDPEIKADPIIVSAIHDASDDLDRDDSAVIWYDMQGRRVLNPISGQIYIRVSRSGARQAVAP